VGNAINKAAEAYKSGLAPGVSGFFEATLLNIGIKQRSALQFWWIYDKYSSEIKTRKNNAKNLPNRFSHCTTEHLTFIRRHHLCHSIGLSYADLLFSRLRLYAPDL